MSFRQVEEHEKIEKAGFVYKNIGMVFAMSGFFEFGFIMKQWFDLKKLREQLKQRKENEK